jgi:menaquinone-dependent protoporphyrinogen oxidase
VKVLISFASTEGQTRKIAERIAARGRERGHEVSLYDCASLVDIPDVDAFEAVIVAASVHLERHQDSIVNFAIAHRDQLSRKSSGFISVSLSAAMEDGQAEAQGYVDRFTATTHWLPHKTLLLGGALRYSKYDYFERQVLKHIVMKRGATPDPDVNYEFTDWKALDSFVDDFLASA